jgi:hypothetical protein
MENEIWKDVPNYEGYYKVSNLGVIKSLIRKEHNHNKILNTYSDRKGYLAVYLYIKTKRKKYRVHQLVAMAFLNHIPNGMENVVDHINNNKLDNRFENLQIITNRENSSKNAKKVNSSSKYTGVSWSKGSKKWQSGIVKDGKRKHLGFFNDELEASKVYQLALENYLKTTNTQQS